MRFNDKRFEELVREYINTVRCYKDGGYWEAWDVLNDYCEETYCVSYRHACCLTGLVRRLVEAFGIDATPSELYIWSNYNSSVSETAANSVISNINKVLNKLY